MEALRSPAAIAALEEIDWLIFVIAFVSALVIALLTVSFESIKAATTNPVKSLRPE